MNLFLALCFLVVAVYAQEPKPCESPKQWEGKQIVYDRSEQYERLAKVSYDETNMRVREVEEILIGKEKDYYDVLYLHSIGKEYRLNLVTKKCNVTNLTRPFRPFGLPPDAEFDGEATLGAPGVPGEYIKIENFSGNTPDGGRYFGVVTYPDCYPVTANFRSKEGELVSFTFIDINIGITDPNVFVPPRECLMQ